MDCSLPGSSIHGIFQARVLEWGAIAFSYTVHGVLQARILEWVAIPFSRGNRWGEQLYKWMNSLDYSFTDVYVVIAMAPHSSTLAWKIPWAEEPGRLQSMGSLRAGHD